MRESNAEHQAITAHRTAIEPNRAGPPPTDAVGGSSNLRRALLLRLRQDGPSSTEADMTDRDVHTAVVRHCTNGFKKVSLRT